MWLSFDLKLDERGVLLKNGIPTRALGPGRHTVFGFGLSMTKLDTKNLVLDEPAEVRAVLPADWWTEVSLSESERAIVKRDGVPRLWLRPGVHRLWRVNPSITIEILSVDGPVPVMTPALRDIVPACEIYEGIIAPTEKGILYVDGRLERVLDPGMYTFWSPPGAEVNVVCVDMRRQEVAIVGQDLLTKDKVTLRLTLSAEIRVSDPVLATASVASTQSAVYTMVQLHARSLISAMTLDELLESRDLLSTKMFTLVTNSARDIGVEVLSVGIKDVILPGEMKTLLNKVIEAEKAAAANVILRREETAATRQLLNTAKLMSENPTLLRMRELETLKEIAGQLKEVKLVIGADKLDELVPRGLFGSK